MFVNLRPIRIQKADFRVSTFDHTRTKGLREQFADYANDININHVEVVDSCCFGGGMLIFLSGQWSLKTSSVFRSRNDIL